MKTNRTQIKLCGGTQWSQQWSAVSEGWPNPSREPALWCSCTAPSGSCAWEQEDTPKWRQPSLWPRAATWTLQTHTWTWTERTLSTLINSHGPKMTQLIGMFFSFVKIKLHVLVTKACRNIRSFWESSPHQLMFQKQMTNDILMFLVPSHHPSNT